MNKFNINAMNLTIIPVTTQTLALSVLNVRVTSFILFLAVMDGWMTCESYRDEGRMIMEGCAHWNSVYG